MRQHIPNFVTGVRILLTPLIAFVIWQPQTAFLAALGLFLFIIAGASDWLDGYLARQMNIISPVGRMLDPIADKVLLIGTVLILWMNSYIPIFVLAVFVLRDFIIIMGAAFHMTVYGTAAPNPNIFGKITTFVHIGYLAGVFIDIIFGLNFVNFMINFSVALIASSRASVEANSSLLMSSIFAALAKSISFNFWKIGRTSFRYINGLPDYFYYFLENRASLF